jgi:hypothetical protein
MKLAELDKKARTVQPLLAVLGGKGETKCGIVGTHNGYLGTAHGPASNSAGNEVRKEAIRHQGVSKLPLTTLFARAADATKTRIKAKNNRPGENTAHHVLPDLEHN